MNGISAKKRFNKKIFRIERNIRTIRNKLLCSSGKSLSQYLNWWYIRNDITRLFQVPYIIKDIVNNKLNYNFKVVITNRDFVNIDHELPDILSKLFNIEYKKVGIKTVKHEFHFMFPYDLYVAKVQKSYLRDGEFDHTNVIDLYTKFNSTKINETDIEPEPKTIPIKTTKPKQSKPKVKSNLDVGVPVKKFDELVIDNKSKIDRIDGELDVLTSDINKLEDQLIKLRNKRMQLNKQRTKLKNDLVKLINKL